MSVDFKLSTHFLALSVSATIALIYAITRIKHYRTRKLPPGPNGIPFFGHCFSISAKPWNDFEVWAKQYGKLALRTFLMRFVALNHIIIQVLSSILQWRGKVI